MAMISSTLCPVFPYPGFKVKDFMRGHLEFYKQLCQKSTIALVVGANDIGRSSAAHIAEEVKDLCFRFHSLSPQSCILVSEILPRGRDLFHEQTPRRIESESIFLEEWNAVAAEVNCRLRELAGSFDWLTIISQWQFHSMSGAHRRLLGRDGLHLSIEGTELLSENLGSAISAVKRVVHPTVPSVLIKQDSPDSTSPVSGQPNPKSETGAESKI
ncbi:hypothetical protein DPMN_093471 [Dreissena polymorpha]|uniref:SGNH hydrolase-type esterase domain-containing protein n=1 Tax=Dreissena polymorpha TaxID=45954 RepID=A0A9D4R114_DREPO|nr:hypothetical protein DPMN_093471 [Dreissena polymorpha]